MNERLLPILIPILLIQGIGCTSDSSRTADVDRVTTTNVDTSRSPSEDDCDEVRPVVAQQKQHASNDELVTFAVCAERDGDRNDLVWSAIEMAHRGHRIFQHHVGLWYVKGEGVVEDAFEGFRYVYASAQAGYVPAQVTLGAMYIEGRGVTRDFDAGVRLWQMAAASGDPQAQAALASLESGDVNDDKPNQYGGSVSFELNPPAPNSYDGSGRTDGYAASPHSYGGSGSPDIDALVGQIERDYRGNGGSDDWLDVFDEWDRRDRALAANCRQNVPGACAEYDAYRAARARTAGYVVDMGNADARQRGLQNAARQRELDIRAADQAREARTYADAYKMEAQQAAGAGRWEEARDLAAKYEHYKKIADQMSQNGSY